MNNKQSISLVLPIHNEQGNIEPLYHALCDVFDEQWHDLEMVFVDDGSTDRSAEIIKELNRRDPRVKLLSFSRNFGHQAAVTAGLESARGSAVIMMDADMQHPPELIPKLIEQWKDGYDVVATIRQDTEETGFLKRLTSRWFYRTLNAIAGTKLAAGSADFRLLDRKVVDCLNTMPERSRFLRGLVDWVGFRQTTVSYVVGKRFSGTSSYTPRKMLSFAAAGITSFSTFPLHLAAYLGFFTAIIGVPYALWAVYLRLFTDNAVSGWASLIVAILFLGGVQLMCLGVLGEYVGRIYDEVKQRPLYITREKIGFSDPPSVEADSHQTVLPDDRSSTVSATSLQESLPIR